MKSYNVSGTASHDVKVTPPIRKGERVDSWVYAENKVGAKKAFKTKMLHCYGINVTDMTIWN